MDDGLKKYLDAEGLGNLWAKIVELYERNTLVKLEDEFLDGFWETEIKAKIEETDELA